MKLFDPKKLINPTWTKRNQLIAQNLPPGKSVLDLGCGEKDFLRYYHPSKYCGVDGLPSADIILNLNDSIDLLRGGWDIVLNSGILEYLNSIPSYLEKIHHLGEEFIFTWWPKKNTGRMSQIEFIELLCDKGYMVNNTLSWFDTQIYFCSYR